MRLFLELSLAELRSLAREKTLFFFPIGLLENHGPHLPLGLDLLEAEQICLRLATQLEKEPPAWQCILMPNVAMGLESTTSLLALKVRPYVLRDYLVDHCIGLNRMGFSYFLAYSAFWGPRQFTALEEARRIIQFKQFFSQYPRPKLIPIASALVDFKSVLKAPFWPSPNEHAGEIDSSLALAIRPDLVSPQYKELARMDQESSLWRRLIPFPTCSTQEYWGDPASATAKKGEILLNEKIELMLKRLNPVLEGRAPVRSLQTWYSIFPNNKSFFRACLLTLVIFSLLSFVFFLSLSNSANFLLQVLR